MPENLRGGRFANRVIFTGRLFEVGELRVLVDYGKKNCVAKIPIRGGHRVRGKWKQSASMNVTITAWGRGSRQAFRDEEGRSRSDRRLLLDSGLARQFGQVVDLLALNSVLGRSCQGRGAVGAGGRRERPRSRRRVTQSSPVIIRHRPSRLIRDGPCKNRA